jgi:hypothetical protein
VDLNCSKSAKLELSERWPWQLGDYISQCKAKGGAVTINLGVYQDGTVDPNAVDVLKEVRKRVR